jgi:hypothetical protein
LEIQGNVGRTKVGRTKVLRYRYRVDHGYTVMVMPDWAPQC